MKLSKILSVALIGGLFSTSLFAANLSGTTWKKVNKNTQKNFFLLPKYTKYENKTNAETETQFSIDVGYKLSHNTYLIVPYSQSDIKVNGLQEVSNKRYGVLFGYETPFFIRNLSLMPKIGYIKEDNDIKSQEALAYGADLTYYLNNSFALVVGYEKNELETSFSDSSFSAGIRMSF